MKTDAVNAVIAGLRDTSVAVVATLPEGKLRQLVVALGNHDEFVHVPVCREEEAIGVVCGAYLAGKRAVMVCMSAGVLTCPNALVTLSLAAQIPVAMVVGYSGGLSEDVWLHTPLGLYLEPVLDALHIPYREASSADQAREVVAEIVEWSYKARRPAAALLNREALR